MKGMISLRTQYIIMLIPFINCLLIFIWLYNYSRFFKNVKVFFKALVMMFAVGITIVIIDILLKGIFPFSSVMLTVINCLIMYITPFLIGLSLIKLQKKLLDE